VTLLRYSNINDVVIDKMSDFNSLPNELLVHVFDHLDKVNLCVLRLVSVKVKEAATLCCFREMTATVFDDALFMNSCSKSQATPLAQVVRTVYITPYEVPDFISAARSILELNQSFPQHQLDTNQWTSSQLMLALDHACGLPLLQGMPVDLTSLMRLNWWNQCALLEDDVPMEQLPFQVLLKLFEEATPNADQQNQAATIRKLEVSDVPPLRHLLLTGRSHF
jgi:hypothetical protein